MTGGQALIELRSMSKRYASRRGEVDALADVTLDVQREEFVSIVGPSGCGKSTLLKILLGVMPASGGRVAIAGESVTAPRTDVGMMFQSPTLLPWRSVLSNVLLPIEMLRLDRRQFADRARELLDLVGLSGFADHYPGELSGGMQQRAAMCRALIHDPDILLLDEPFGALDSITREQLNDELQRIWARTKKTVVLVTHSIDEAVYLSDRVVVMSARPGRLVDARQVELPRPRTMETRSLPEFDALGLEIRRALGHASGTGGPDA